MGKIKEIEVIYCHCGHEAPIEFAYDNGEGRWLCAKCMVEHLSHEYHRVLAQKIENLTDQALNLHGVNDPLQDDNEIPDSDSFTLLEFG